jgi:hypothetical protein
MNDQKGTPHQLMRRIDGHLTEIAMVSGWLDAMINNQNHYYKFNDPYQYRAAMEALHHIHLAHAALRTLYDQVEEQDKVAHENR